MDGRLDVCVNRCINRCVDGCLDKFVRAQITSPWP